MSLTPESPVGDETEALRTALDKAYKLANNKNLASGEVFHAVAEARDRALARVAG